MSIHPEIFLDLARQRHRELAAEAARHRQAAAVARRDDGPSEIPGRLTLNDPKKFRVRPYAERARPDRLLEST